MKLSYKFAIGLAAAVSPFLPVDGGTIQTPPHCFPERAPART